MHCTRVVPVTGPYACLGCGARYELVNEKNLHCRWPACARDGGRLVPFDDKFVDRFAAAHQQSPKSDDANDGHGGRRARRRGHGVRAMGREIVFRRGKSEAFVGSVPIDDDAEVGIDSKNRVVVVTDEDGEEIASHAIPKGCTPFVRDSSDEQDLEEVEPDEDEEGEDEEDEDEKDD